MASLWYDVKYALRGIGHRPGHTALVVLSLAVGLGVNTVAFSSVNALIFRPFHIANASEYGWVFVGPPRDRFRSASRDMFDTLRAKASSLETLVAEGRAPLEARTPTDSESLWGLAVSADYFTVVRVPLVAGRALSPTDTADHGLPILISERYWRTRWNASPDLAAIRLVLNGQDAAVMGVIADTYQGPGGIFEPHLWFPLDATPLLHLAMKPDDEWLTMMGRPQKGATPAQIGAEVEAIAAGVDANQPDADPARGARRGQYVPISKGHPEARGLVPAAALAMLAMGLVLLIACFNVAGLILARSAERQRELGLRAALGASRLRLTRQLLVEGLVLSTIAGAAALLLAQWSGAILGGLSLPAPIPQRLHFTMDWRMVAFTAALVVVSATVPVLAPAWHVFRNNPVRWLKDAATGAGGGAAPARTRRGFMVVQVMGATTFLVLALMFVTSYLGVSYTDPGFNTTQVAIMQIAPAGASITPERQRALVTDLVSKVNAAPGVAGVALAERVSFEVGAAKQHLLSADGRDCTPATCVRSVASGVTTTYFDTMEIPLRAGRLFDDTSAADAETAVISEAAAAALWPGADPLGQWVYEDAHPRPRLVIGVVADVVESRFDRPNDPYLYRPLTADARSEAMTVVVRSRTSSGAAATLLRETWRNLDDESRPPVLVQTIQERLALPLWPSRVAAAFFATCGTLAVILVTVGLFGITYFTVTQRTREFGIRLALGATAADLRRLVIGESLRLVTPGLALGLVAAAILGSLASAALVGVAPLDPRWYVGAVALQAGVTLLASWSPARRASRVVPQTALRGE